MGIILKSKDEIELIRKSSLLVGKTLAEIAALLKPGITTRQIDELAEQFIKGCGGVPVFKGYKGFPASLCISVNSEIVHGIPGSRVLEEGDVVSVDCGVVKDGYVGDSAYTFAIGNIRDETLRLLSVTRQCLMNAISYCKPGNRVGDIGAVVQETAQKSGFSVVRELVGHGVGKNLHEKPEVPNYGRKGSGALLKPGMVIAIEPMINQGKKEVKTLSDKWTVVAVDDLPSAHYEHTVAITETGCDVLSSFTEIENAERANVNLNSTYY